MKHWLTITRGYLKYLTGYQTNTLSKTINYKNNETFTPRDKELVGEKLEQLFAELKKIQIGQQIIYDDLTDDFETMKTMLEVLSKKDWFQLLKGKLLDAGLGTLSSEAFKLVLNSFSGNRFLG